MSRCCGGRSLRAYWDGSATTPSSLRVRSAGRVVRSCTGCQRRRRRAYRRTGRFADLIDDPL